MLDALLFFAGKPGVPLAITAGVDSDVIDMLAQRDVGVGNDIELHVDVATAFVGAGAALQITFYSSPDGTNFFPELLSPPYAAADLKKGANIFRYVWPQWQLNNPGPKPGRYYKLVFAVSTGPFTAGAIYAYANGIKDRDAFRVYGPNYAVAN